jgi:AcrR family transcriptional regulator
VTKDNPENEGRRRYSSALRESQAEITERRIMEAMAAIVAESGAESVTQASVAKRAKVAERTLYRHYPTKDALWEAFLQWVSEQVGLGVFPQDEQDLLSTVPEMFARFDEHEQLMRNCLSSRAWSEIWIRDRQGLRRSVEEAIARCTEGADPAKVNLLGAVMQLLFSGLAWKSLKEHWGLTGPEAAEAVTMTIRLLFAELRRDPSLRRRLSDFEPEVDENATRGQHVDHPEVYAARTKARRRISIDPPVDGHGAPDGSSPEDEVTDR